MSQTEREAEVALYVDLDGTLLASDLLWESAFVLLRSSPLDALKMPLWLIGGGKANLKRQIAERVTLDASTLPYRPEVLAYLREQKERGRTVVLATASHERLARAVADHLDVFDDVLASNACNNLKGESKLQSVLKHTGGAGFDYLGDSEADRPLWRSARRSLLVGSESSARRLMRGLGDPHQVFGRPGARLLDVARALRPHQWAKNALLAVPLVTSHRVTDPPLIVRLILAIVAFSLSASAVYVLNDLLDLESDRRHHSKRRRPFAAGLLPIPAGVGLIVALIGLAAALTLALPASFATILALYLALTTAYSVYLKRKLMVDVLCLAALYTIRILAGGVATTIVVSDWLMAFSTFFFLSLAMAKRFTELDRTPGEPGHRLSGRSYMPEDLELMRSMGPTSGFLSVLVFALYINQSQEVQRLYHRPELLWLACPVLLYWIARVWFLAGRGQLDDDPVVFALRDRISYVALALMALILAAAL